MILGVKGLKTNEKNDSRNVFFFKNSVITRPHHCVFKTDDIFSKVSSFKSFFVFAGICNRLAVHKRPKDKNLV